MPSTTNVPNDREDPRDCNPMFKRLPAEVVARRGDRGGKKGAAQEKAPAATAELEQVLQKRADGRAKWLAKALIQASDGRMDVESLYRVVAHNRFIEDLSEKVGNKMYRALHANLHVFSSKQRRYLEKDCALAKKYGKSAFAAVQKDAPDEDSKQEQAANAVEDMMARCRAFVRERQSERGERGDQPENGEAGALQDTEVPGADAASDLVEEATLKESTRGLIPAPAAEETKQASPPPPAPEAVATKGAASRSRSDPKPKASEKQATKTKSKKKKRESSSRSRRRSSDSRSDSRKRRKHRKDSRSSGSSSGRRDAKKSRKRKSKDSDSSERSKKRKKKKH